MKKTIALTLIILIICATFTTAFASDVTTEDIAKMMKSLNIIRYKNNGCWNC